MRRALGLGCMIVLGCGPATQPSPEARPTRTANVEVTTPSPKPAEEPAPPPAPPEEPAPPPAPALALRIDPRARSTSPPKLDATIRHVDCVSASEHPVPCGFALQCRDLSKRWFAQLGFADDPDLAPLVTELDARSYPEQPCTNAPPSDALDFAARAVMIEQEIGMLALDHVGGLLVETAPGRYRGLARTHETIMTGMATQITYEPVASWERDIDGRPGRELILLILGDDGGHTQDPMVDAIVVICGTQPEPWCGRLSLGRWIPDGVAGDDRPDTVNTLEIDANGALRLGERTLTLDQLDRADRKLDRRWR